MGLRRGKITSALAVLRVRQDTQNGGGACLERTMATLERLLSLLSAFEVVVWMTDGWPLYESRFPGTVFARRRSGLHSPHEAVRHGIPSCQAEASPERWQSFPVENGAGGALARLTLRSCLSPN